MSAYKLVAIEHFEIQVVEQAWQQLARRIGSLSVFLDWFWIGSWLRQVSHLKPNWICIYHNDDLVAMGFVCFYSRRVAGFPIHQGYLNRTGRPEYDQTWIEFNDLLVVPDHREQAITQFLDWCAQQPVDEWIIALSKNAQQWRSSQHLSLSLDTVTAYSKALSADIQHFDSYVNTLSTNSRGKLRRAKRYLEQTYGDIEFNTIAGEIDQSQWTELMQLHRMRWQNIDAGSGFDNPNFVDFHRYLMQHPSAQCRVETLCFFAGKQLLGYLYNLVQGTTVSFYLSAINYSDPNNRYQPGLVMHALAIAHYAEQGKALYDFMGGENQYKKSLADKEYDLYFIKLSPNTIKNKCLGYLRALRSYVRKN